MQYISSLMDKIDEIGVYTVKNTLYLYDFMFKLGFSHASQEDKVILTLFYNPSEISSLVELIEKYNKYIYEAIALELFDIAEYLRYRQLKLLAELKFILKERLKLILAIALKEKLFKEST